MTHCNHRVFGRFCAVLLLSLGMLSAAHAQTTVFSYQGKLTDAGNPANGNYDLQFQLFDAVTSGALQGTQVRNPVAASAGIFTVTLDFGATVFDGSSRYLEIGVRPAGSGAAYSVLTPRQPITSAPYAIETLKLGGLPASRYVATDAAGNVGLGGSALPNSRLAIISDSTQVPPRAVSAGSGDNFAAGWDFYHGATGIGYVGAPNAGASFGAGEVILFGGPGVNTSIWGQSARGITVGPSGRVGIGSAPTSSQLIVNGGTSSDGINSFSTNGYAAFAQSTNSHGVVGFANSGRGVYGDSISGSGVYGASNAASVTAAGVYGKGKSTGSIGVIGEGSFGNATGVFGVSDSSTGFGMYARNLAGGRALYAEGNVAQDRASNGIMKAMAFINQNGSIARCYNGITNSYSGGCGFSVVRPGAAGYYDVGFGFKIDDRFVSVNSLNNGGTGGCDGGDATIDLLVNTVVRVTTFCSSFTDKPFMIFIY